KHRRLLREPRRPEGRLERLHRLLDEARRRLHAGQPRVRRAERELADLPHRALRPHHPAGVPANGTPALDLPPGRGSRTDCRVGMLRTATHVLLALALVVATTGLTGRVLCLGGDGHREIEARDAACCGAKAPGNGPALDARCAGECVDTPLSLSAIHPKSDHVAPMVAGAALATPVDGLASAWPASLPPAHRIAPSRPPRALGTAVNLC